MNKPVGKLFYTEVAGRRFDATYEVKGGRMYVKYSGLERSAPRNARDEFEQAQAILKDLVNVGPGSS